MSFPATFKWIGLALLGLAIAAAVAIAASHLTSQQIGLASESITAGDKLAPAARSANAGKRPANRSHTGTTPATTTPASPPTTTVTPPPTVPPPVTTVPPPSGDSSDDHGGSSSHVGGGGADD
jgi:hypothetical protein